MSIYECRKVKIGRGGAGDLDARGNLCVYTVYIYMQRCRRIYRFFFCAIYISFFSLDKN